MRKILIPILALFLVNSSAFAVCEKEVEKFEAAAIRVGKSLSLIETSQKFYNVTGQEEAAILKSFTDAGKSKTKELAAKAELLKCLSNIPAQASNATCSAGQVFTQYGCLKQGQCPAGQGFYEQTNSCVPSAMNNYTNGYGTSYQYNNQYSCAAGQVFTQFGCLPQGTCQAGMGFSQTYNTCVPAVNSGYNNGYNSGTGFCIGFGCH